MHDEAMGSLPAVLDAIGFQRGLLIGHSDGASIATIFAGAHADHRVRGVGLIAPHFIVEDISLESIAAAKVAYEAGDLRMRLARWHSHVDVAFRGWNDAWLDPEFRKWDISEYLGFIRVPIQILQGQDDQYGTARQIEIAREQCYCPVDVMLMRGVRHTPQREAPEATLGALGAFYRRIFEFHEARGACRISDDMNKSA